MSRDLSRADRQQRLSYRSLPALILLCAAVVATLAPPSVLWLDVGSPGDEPFVAGFYPAEMNAHESFRWSEGDATLILPVERSGRYRVELALAVIEPAGRTLSMRCGDDTNTLALDRQPGNSTVVFDCRAAGGELSVELSVPTVQIGGSAERPLGISVRDARVAALDWPGMFLARARVATAVLGTLGAAWLLAAAFRFRRPGLFLVALAGAGWLALTLIRPEWVLPAVAGPAGLLALVGGAVAWYLSRDSIRAARVVALLAPLALVVLPQQELVLTLPSRWIAGDLSAVALTPWLVTGTILVAGWSKALYLAVAGSLVALGTSAMPVAAKLVVERHDFTLAVPDWTDQVSVAGACYLLAIVAILLVGIATEHQRGALAVVPIVALGLAAMLGWRVAVMDFNGDEPHYYVTARSLGSDYDLELLNNYHEESYRENTISPDGNIAVVRDATADRYTPVFQSDPGHGENAGTTDAIRLANGSMEWVPPLGAGISRTLLFTGDCDVDSVQVAAPDGGSRDVHLYLRNAAGLVIWESESTFASVAQIPLRNTCRGHPSSLTIESSNGPIFAYAVDEHAGLKMLPGRGAGDLALLGSLPRDRYAYPDVVTELALHNPGSRTVTASIALLGGNSEPQDILVDIPGGGTALRHLRTQGYEAIRVDPADRLVVQGIGRVWAGTYALPTMETLDEWTVALPADGTHDSGVWLSLANESGDTVDVTVDDGGDDRLVEMCAGCFETLLLARGEHEREVVVRAEGHGIVASAVQYEERTGSLHFDPGLPLLAAPLARFGSPMAVLLVPLLAAVAMAPGLVLLLKRVGVGEPGATACAAGVVLLAPVSPYATRLYTEIVAACLLVWALVLWDMAGRRTQYLLPFAGIALLLPVLHGRFVVLASALGLLVVLRVFPMLSRLNRQSGVALAGSMLALGLLAVVAVQLSVGLRERVTASYIATNWADVGLAGVVLDRGSGVLPFAPWLLLALFVPRPLQPLQRVALGLVLLQLAAVIVRAGGWQTWGAPARYVLPVVALLALLIAPAMQRLWVSRPARPVMLGLIGWGVAMTFMLHWLPLSGYVLRGRYLVDEAWRGVIEFSPMVLFPRVTPAPGSFLIGTTLTFALLAGAAWLLLSSTSLRPKRAVGAQSSVREPSPNPIPGEIGFDDGG